MRLTYVGVVDLVKVTEDEVFVVCYNMEEGRDDLRLYSVKYSQKEGDVRVIGDVEPVPLSQGIDLEIVGDCKFFTRFRQYSSTNG